MVNRKIFPAVLAGAIALGVAGGVIAETGKGQPAWPRVKTAVLAKPSLGEVVSAVEQRTGGRALEIEIEHEGGTPLYEVKVLTNGELARVYVGIGDGKVIRTEKMGLIARTLEREDLAELARYTALPTTLSAAIKTASQYAGGKAVAAEVESENGKMLIQVKVAKGQAVQAVKIDATTGKIAKTAGENEHGNDGEHDD